MSVTLEELDQLPEIKATPETKPRQEPEVVGTLKYGYPIGTPHRTFVDLGGGVLQRVELYSERVEPPMLMSGRCDRHLGAVEV